MTCISVTSINEFGTLINSTIHNEFFLFYNAFSEKNIQKHAHTYFISSFIHSIERIAAKCSCIVGKLYKTRQKYIDYAIIETTYVFIYEFNIQIYNFCKLELFDWFIECECGDEDVGEGWWCDWCRRWW